jgi:prevent-host-death family protein
MKRVGAREAKNRFGQLIDDAQRGPVTIEKNGRPFAVVQSFADFEATQQIKLEAMRLGIGEARAAILSDHPMPFDETSVEEIKAAGRKKLAGVQTEG